MIGVKNFGAIMALRFLLGFFESALVPGLLLGESTSFIAHCTYLIIARIGFLFGSHNYVVQP